MVYCGRPSKGCSHCRERKIRCDQKEPGCGQCEKRKAQCPGYRNQQDLMFRDESLHVIRKAKAKQRRRKGTVAASQEKTPGNTPATPALSPSDMSTAASPSPLSPASLMPSPAATPAPFFQREGSVLTPTSRKLPSILTPKSYASEIWTMAPDESFLPSPDSEEYPRTPSVALGYSLTPSLQEKGTAFFFSKFVSSQENSCNHQFNFVFKVWKPASLLPERQVDSVMASMTAVGLAGLAQVTESDEMRECAWKSYGTALRLTKLATEDQVEAVKDTTMLSVLILGIFEMVVGSREPLLAWHKHIDGAAALAKMRGPAQFNTPSGINMFIMLNYSVVLSCIVLSRSMPQGIMELRKHMPRFKLKEDGAPFQPDDSKTGGLGPMKMLGNEPILPIHKLLQARHDLKEGVLGDPHERVKKLLEIEDDFDAWFYNFPESSRYRMVRIKQSNPAVLGEVCHTYASMQHGAIWSGMRSCRLLVLEMLRLELTEGFESTPPIFTTTEHLKLYHRTEILLRQLGDAIVKSTPFNLCKIRPNSNPADFVTISTVVAVHEPASRVSSPQSSVSGGSRPTSPQEGVNSPIGLSRPQYLGPTLLDPAASGALTAEEGKARLNMLASANNFMLIPLYLAGMSSVCTPEIKTYVVERLDAIWKENGVEQAQAAMAIVEEHDLDCHRKVRLPTKLNILSHDVLMEQKAACAKVLM